MLHLANRRCWTGAIAAGWFAAAAAFAQIESLSELSTSADPVGPARVVVVEDRGVISEFSARTDRVAALLDRGLTNLLKQASVRAAWLSLVSTQDVVGIKVHTGPGATSGTRMAVVEAAVQGLLDAGLPPRQIIVWDRHGTDLRRAGYGELSARFGIRIAGAAEAGYDEMTYYDNPLLGKLVWGDSEFGKTGDGIGRKSFVSRLVTRDITKIISIVPLLNHNKAGVAGHLYGLAVGSIDNSIRFEGAAARLAEAVPEIYALPSLGDRVVLNITDALLCQYHGGENPLLHYMSVKDQIWLSRDPVALDVLGLEELEQLQRASKGPAFRPGKTLYENAGLLELGQHDLKRILIERLP